ncbi:MAG TPA: thiamine pyrophosphate-dependent enzyme [Steroidobacteraceae bacterium]|nr:thiamine pyrophosphate-dependent enzyme [Steroidobacteraceae bacterium]
MNAEVRVHEVATRLQRAYLVRAVEERLLRLFSEGKLTGTTHTCIGQELSAISLADSLDRQRDIIFSNHRCHGHYIAWTDDVEGLLAEVMGKHGGVCAGIGGSQHLCGERFFSNGIQGGIVPVSAGLAFAQKLAGERGIVAVCIGDGTLGEGVIYEAFNIASKWSLPLLVVLENNLYAQSTSQSETLAGDICARAAAFAMRTFHADTWAHEQLAHEMQSAADFVRERCAPALIRVDTYRLAAHSKGDDNRDAAEISSFAVRDPVNLFISEARVNADPVLGLVDARVSRAVDLAAGQGPREQKPVGQAAAATALAPAAPRESGTQLEAINRELHAWMARDPAVIVLGEDIRSPYGGAFKVTRGLSDAFPDRVLNTPISEAAIVGVGNGLALAGRRPVVEIMFGDFLTLCFDQVMNHAAKFHGMYAGRVTNPLVIRTPMGGGRGYGPTHSQNLEKHFVGIPGLTTLVLHGRTHVGKLYAGLAAATHPVLMIENKLGYRDRSDAALPPGYSLYESGDMYATTALRPAATADLTIVAFGRMSVLAEKALAQLARDEVCADLLLPLQVSPLDTRHILESVARTGKLVIVEEGTAGFDLASEVIASVSIAYRGAKRLHVRRIAARPEPIPSAIDLEQQVLPSERDIVAACLELFDA